MADTKGYSHLFQSSEEKRMIAANKEQWSKEVKSKIEAITALLDEQKAEDMLELWHGPEFFDSVCSHNTQEERQEIATSYSTGPSYESETSHWVQATNEDKYIFSLGLPEGLELGGFSFDERKCPVLEVNYPVASEEDEGEGEAIGGFFLVQVAPGEWFAPW
mmetsp:Transcript_21734/g.30718  ORF Transcript_21734/g.30718 Transcript_21734/m.30718 type:complete len:162 (-) Transcript_21734:197-682(-)